MTNQYLRNAVSDYITGTISACEGIRKNLVLLNGPIGCKTYYTFSGVDSVIRRSDLWNLRGNLQLEDAMEDHLLRSQYCVGSARTPATNLRYTDYIFGTGEQLHRALNDFFAERSYNLFTVIQTPGTSLLGEALEPELNEISKEFGIPHLFIESPVPSENSMIGYDETTVRLMELLCSQSIVRKKSADTPKVNIFGFDAHEKFPEGGLKEITRLLNLCNIEVHAAVGINCSLEDFSTISQADASIVLCPERCKKTAEYLRTRLNMPVYETGGMPIGFDLTEEFVRGVSSFLETDCSKALDDIEQHRARAFYYIAHFMGNSGFPRDLRYAAEGEPSVLRGYVDFLSGYLGIKPKAIHPLYTQCHTEDLIRKKLQELHCEDALEQDFSKVNNVLLLAGANTIVELNTYSDNIFGIETANPGSGYIHVIPKTYIGCEGALYLLEQVLNGTKLLRAWN
ncbi:nitrogenase component 1 [Blautia sp.]